MRNTQVCPTLPLVVFALRGGPGDALFRLNIIIHSQAIKHTYIILLTPAAAATTPTTNKSVPSYHDKDGNIHYPALKSTHRHFLDQGVLLIWRCGRCTSRNAAEATDCGGCGCGHRRCGRDCEWLMRKGVGGKRLTAAAAAAAATKAQGSGPQHRAQLPEQWQNAGFDDVASGAAGGGQVGGAAADNDVEDDSDDAVLLPTPPREMTEWHGAAESTFVEQTPYWTCCYCGKDGNPTAAASCPMALCGHSRCASHCATRWVDGCGE